MNDHLRIPTRLSAPGVPTLDETPQDDGASGAGEGVLDQATIRQLRETVTAATREKLLDVFEEQHATCLTDIVSAVKRDDRVEIRAVAHLLKGSSASLGAIRLLGLCQRMEHVGRAGDPGIDDEQLRELASAAVEASRALRQELI